MIVFPPAVLVLVTTGSDAANDPLASVGAARAVGSAKSRGSSSISEYRYFMPVAGVEKVEKTWVSERNILVSSGILVALNVSSVGRALDEAATSYRIVRIGYFSHGGGSAAPARDNPDRVSPLYGSPINQLRSKYALSVSTLKACFGCGEMTD